MAIFSRGIRNAKPTEAQPENLSGSPAIDAHSIDSGLSKSRMSLRQGLGRLIGSNPTLDDDAFDRLEDLLITSDIGAQSSLELVGKLRNISIKHGLTTPSALVEALRLEIGKILAVAEQEWRFDAQPHVIMMVGVNGVGKTTTTAKIAHSLVESGHSVMMAAADTFRAAAVGQLREWGQRLDIPVIAQGDGADAAAVAHDALTAAISRKSDVLLIDTAGRLHTQTDLMGQLEKMKRVLHGIVPGAPQEVMQVIDAGTGQNAISQLQSFHECLGVDSLVVTKLDGSARGGVLVALTGRFRLPVRFVGIGEAFGDLRPFSASAYADALLPAGPSDEPQHSA
jgi:fused signal recognition particle receptor